MRPSRRRERVDYSYPDFGYEHEDDSGDERYHQLSDDKSSDRELDLTNSSAAPARTEHGQPRVPSRLKSFRQATVEISS